MKTRVTPSVKRNRKFSIDQALRDGGAILLVYNNHR